LGFIVQSCCFFSCHDIIKNTSWKAAEKNSWKFDAVEKIKTRLKFIYKPFQSLFLKYLFWVWIFLHFASFFSPLSRHIFAFYYKIFSTWVIVAL
jgi:hypothetical protein